MNTSVKEDRRVRKTKKALRECLAELLTEKNIQDITVRELTDKADIHRSTFYANYTDIYDLYKQIEDAVVQEISEIISVTYSVDSNAFFRILFKYISENRQVCRMFLGKNVSPTFSDRLTDMFKEACLICWSDITNTALNDSDNTGIKQNCDNYGFTGTAATKEQEYYIHFYLSGSLAVVSKWADGNFEYSAERLIMMLTDIYNNWEELIKLEKIQQEQSSSAAFVFHCKV